MKVADLGAGGGYTTELLARAVGPTGVVYGQNSKFLLERFAEKPWSARLERPVNAVVVRADREFDDPIPPEAKGQLDLVVDVLFYHDTVGLEFHRGVTGAHAEGASVNAAARSCSRGVQLGESEAMWAAKVWLVSPVTMKV
jgi:predicted methyltransferase